MSNDIENPHANIPRVVNDGHKPTPKGVMGRVQEGVQSWKENLRVNHSRR